jgi:hypothetical protein
VSLDKGNWTDTTWNLPAWVNRNVTFCTRVCDIHILSSSSHFLTSPQIHWDWNNHGSFWNIKLDLSTFLSNFAEIKCYIFNFIWDFCFFLTFYADLGFLTLSFCVCFMILSSLVVYSHNLSCKGWICYSLFFVKFFLFLIESNRLITRLNRKPKPVKTDLYFMGGLYLTFLLYGLT